jgi:hypothetical protein
MRLSMSIRQVCVLPVVLVMALAACGKSKQVEQQAEAKKAEEAEIDKRAKAIAGELVQKATEDEAKRQELAAQQKQDARKAEWQRVVDHPDQVLEVGQLETAGSSTQRLTRISVTNKSRFAVTDVRGTLDFHVRDSAEEVAAKVPVTLTGSIGPGASMVFSERQHTLTGAAIKLDKGPTRVTFTVVGVASVDPGSVEQAPAAADGGVTPAPDRQ